MNIVSSLVTCHICKETFCQYDYESEPDTCKTCFSTIPYALRKAENDPFDYALQLTNGLIIRFETLDFLNRNWIRIPDECIKETHPWERIQRGTPAYPYHTYGPLNFTFDRGIEININQIVWVTDAPEGS